MRPDRLTGDFVEAEHPFDFRVEYLVGHKHAAVGDDRPRIATSNLGPPPNLQAVNGDRLNNPSLPPNTIAICSPPLWPILGSLALGRYADCDAENQRHQTDFR